MKGMKPFASAPLGGLYSSPNSSMSFCAFSLNGSSSSLFCSSSFSTYFFNLEATGPAFDFVGGLV